jgi:hypothetical protein
MRSKKKATNKQYGPAGVLPRASLPGRRKRGNEILILSFPKSQCHCPHNAPWLPELRRITKTGNFCTSGPQKKLDSSTSTTCADPEYRIPVSHISSHPLCLQLRLIPVLNLPLCLRWPSLGPCRPPCPAPQQPSRWTFGSWTLDPSQRNGTPQCKRVQSWCKNSANSGTTSPASENGTKRYDFTPKWYGRLHRVAFIPAPGQPSTWVSCTSDCAGRPPGQAVESV